MDDIVLVNKGASDPIQEFARRGLQEIALEKCIVTPMLMNLGICSRLYMTAANESGAKV